MSPFEIRNNEYHCEGVPLSKIAREQGTPVYVYSRTALAERCNLIKEAFKGRDFLPCYAVKANCNLSVLREIALHGFGADVVSVGEMERALNAGIPASQVVFSGVGKTASEIERALHAGILSFNVESVEELKQIGKLAQKLKKRAPIAFRVNPNVDAQTNPYIATGLYSTKFGIAVEDVDAFLDVIRSYEELELVGLSCHIGSQITGLGPFREAAASMRELCEQVQAKGFKLKFLDMGGGLGIRYDQEEPPSMAAYAEALLSEVGDLGLKILIEPGRSIVGNIGVLVTEVQYIKTTPAKTFVIVDAAMNDLLRPSLYKSFHGIEPVKAVKNAATETVDVVGPICESSDFLAKDRPLPAVVSGDLLMVRSCGAYASSMASNYNSRPRAPEVLVTGEDYRVVRTREHISDLWKREI